MRLVGVPLWIVVLASCSLKRDVFEGISAGGSPGDAAVAEDAGGRDTSDTSDASPMPDAVATGDAGPDGGPDAMPAALGTRDNPARDCGQLLASALPSAVYWVHGPDSAAPAFQVYCEQQLNGGGWALLENSVRRTDGTTTTFWQFSYDQRLARIGVASPDENYYDGSLYTIGTSYMDVFVDLRGGLAVAATMTASGIDTDAMRFTDPAFVGPEGTGGTGGLLRVYQQQFAAGWSSKDHDGDLYTGPLGGGNCATYYSNVAQHYGTCWYYNLGSDAGESGPPWDFAGPHVENGVLGDLGLALEADGGPYSQVQRIARFTRW